MTWLLRKPPGQEARCLETEKKRPKACRRVNSPHQMCNVCKSVAGTTVEELHRTTFCQWRESLGRLHRRRTRWQPANVQFKFGTSPAELWVLLVHEQPTWAWKDWGPGHPQPRQDTCLCLPSRKVILISLFPVSVLILKWCYLGSYPSSIAS